MKMHRASRLSLAANIVAMAVMSAGCTSLLPHGSSGTPSPFETFAQAEAAASRIVPFRTLTGELKALGFDPEGGRNVTLIPYPDILARLVPYGGIAPGSLDPGIRACIEARTSCRAYVFHFERQDRDRVGPFLADFLNFRRQTQVTGWWFDALVVVSDGQVLFRNMGGQPAIRRDERQLNPLGPFQPSGEAVGGLLGR